MTQNGTEAIVATIPMCDIHKYEKQQNAVPAVYDARTNNGQWAFVCEECFITHTAGTLGVGHGQRLVLHSNG